MRKTKRGWRNGPSAICDRSGFRYPMSEMVKEPGTNFLVHKSMSDGMFSITEHPCNNKQRYLKTGDPKPVPNARPYTFDFRDEKRFKYTASAVLGISSTLSPEVLEHVPYNDIFYGWFVDDNKVFVHVDDDTKFTFNAVEE